MRGIDCLVEGIWVVEGADLSGEGVIGADAWEGTEGEGGVWIEGGNVERSALWKTGWRGVHRPVIDEEKEGNLSHII